MMLVAIPLPGEGLRLFGILWPLSIFGACDKALDSFREVIVEMRSIWGTRSGKLGGWLQFLEKVVTEGALRSADSKFRATGSFQSEYELLAQDRSFLDRHRAVLGKRICIH